MHQVPHGKEQARLLQKFLATLDLSLGYQDALEAVARVMGHKNWKTMSARASAPALEPQAEADPIEVRAPGSEEGTDYRVPITVDVSMTASILVKAESRDDALRRAREHASEAYPMAFTLDEGLYRGGGDFYCPDQGAIDTVEKVELTEELVTKGRRTTANNQGLLGQFSLVTHGGNFLIEAELVRQNPDASDEDLRAACMLTVAVSKLEAGAFVKFASYVGEYEYHGDDPGDHLEDLFDSGELLSYVDVFEKR